jgi:acyl-CoA thioesterase I
VGLVAWLAVLVGAVAPAVADPLKVLTIGDSITQGGRRGVQEYTYRWPLVRMLADEGFACDFIGSRSGGLDPDASWPKSFDNQHEGYYGATSAYVRDRLAENLHRLPAPDIALIDLGTNDDRSDAGGSTIAPLEDIVRLLRARNPRVAIYIAQIPGVGVWRRLMIRTRIAWLAARLQRRESPVVAVSQDIGWNDDPNAPDADTFDGVHPNLRGQRKMAERWLAAMHPLLVAHASDERHGAGYHVFDPAMAEVAERSDR